MNKRILLGVSLLLSGLTILYLLAVSIFRDTFIYTDWLIVVFDLSVKTIIEGYILFKRRG